MKRILVVLSLVLLAAPIFAVPVITSVSPNAGPDSGGTIVTITGSGFATCPICSPPSPPTVVFGNVPATSVQLVSSSTLVVTSPVAFPGLVDVTVGQFDGSAKAPNAFTITGDLATDFETILLPVYSAPVHGAFGSEFHTIARAASKNGGSVSLFGSGCFPIDPPASLLTPLILNPIDDVILQSECSWGHARMLYVSKTQATAIALNDRVLDVTQTALSNGTEIPVVRSSRFTSERIKLLGVPVDGRYRNTLRIYARTPVTVNVTIGDETRSIDLKPGLTMFDPAYATFSDFPIPVEPGNETTLDVEIVSLSPAPGVSPSIPGVPIWAFISVTNNQTQQITTITPDL